MTTRLPKLAALAAALLFAPALGQATVLTFDIAGISDFQNINQAYGDNVTAATMGSFTYGTAQGFTPDVTVQYGNTDPALWTTGYGSLANVLFEDADSTGVLNVILGAGPGFNVQLHSFDLAAYTSAFGSDPVISSLRIFDSANTPLFSQTNVPISRTTSTLFSFGTPLEDDVLRIEVDARNLGSLNDDIAIDNVTFGQVVPEPAAVGLCAAVVAAWSLRRRR